MKFILWIYPKLVRYTRCCSSDVLGAEQHEEGNKYDNISQSNKEEN
jgi:hypothetical protein